jgi:hypothetical protein
MPLKIKKPMQTFHSFLESSGSSKLTDLFGDLEDLGFKDKVWDEDQVRTCLEELDWDEAVQIKVDNLFVDFFYEGYKKVALSGEMVYLKPKITGDLLADLDIKSLQEVLRKKLEALPRTTQTKNLATMSQILQGLGGVKWDSIWKSFMDEVNDNFESWVDVSYKAEVNDKDRIPIHIETKVEWDGTKPIRMEEWKPVSRVMDEIDFS